MRQATAAEAVAEEAAAVEEEVEEAAAEVEVEAEMQEEAEAEAAHSLTGHRCHLQRVCPASSVPTTECPAPTPSPVR